MPPSAVVAAKVFVGPVLLDQANSVQFGVAVTELDASRFGTGVFSAVHPGLKAFAANVSGFEDFDGGGAAAVRALTGTNTLMTVCPDGSVAGSLAVMAQGMLAQRSGIAGSVGDLATMDLQIAPVGGVVAEGLVTIAETTTITGATNGAVQQLGALTTAQRVYVGVHLRSITGSTPTLQPILESAALVGFGSPTTRATGTVMSAAGTQWMQSATGVITDQFWRVRFAATGTVTAASALVTIAIA
jgi:hypothetical protein